MVSGVWCVVISVSFFTIRHSTTNHSANYGRQLGNGLVLEDQLRGQVEASLLGQGGHFQRLNRGASQVEEIVVDAHRLDIQNARPDFGQHFFHLGARSGNGARTATPIALDLRKGSAVHLAADGERKLAEHRDKSGHHELRQAFAQKTPYLDRIDGSLALVPKLLFGNDIGDQVLACITPAR